MKKFDVVSHGGEYQKDGETKVRWINHGSIIETNDGKWKLKMDSYAAAGEGWYELFAKQPKPSSKVNQGRETAPQMPQGYGAPDPDDDFPF